MTSRVEPRRLHLLMLALTPATAVSLAMQPVAAQVNPAALKAAQREAWSPGESRAIRAWKIQVADAPLPRESALIPGQGWTDYKSWGDVGELNVAAQRPGQSALPNYVYAFATVERSAAGPAELSLATQAPVAVFVNGEPAGSVEGALAFAQDEYRLPVQLKAGSNTLLIRSQKPTGQWLLAARILNADQPLSALASLAPAIVEDTPGALRLRSDRTSADIPATATLIAPGGETVATATGSRGSVISLDTRALADGPYDIKVKTSDAFGRPQFTFVPWIKGDPSPLARRVLAQAAAPNSDPAVSAHWQFLAALISDRAGADLSRLAAHRNDTVHAVLMEAAELGLGASAAARSSGFVRLGWIDAVDGSPQFCRAYLPEGYDPARAWPTVVNLHGFNPDNPPYLGFWSVDKRHDETADRNGVIWIEPHGRANTQYMWTGEQDVVRCLDEARKQLRVDDTRTYLTGESMGGSGTWLIGARNVDRFAAIAPIFGGWDYRVVAGTNFQNPAADRPMERYQAEAHASFAQAEQLINTPVFVLHGDVDQSVNVEFSRHIVERLQRWNYDIRYRELPGYGHEDLKYRDQVVQWMLQHRLAEAPPKVRIRSINLSGAHAWWMNVKQAQRPLELIEADAEMIEPGRLRLDTRNVAVLTLTPPASLLVANKPLAVVWNGRPVTVPATGQSFTLAAPDAPHGPLAKSAALQGGLSDIFRTPFIIVVGTQSHDPAMNRVLRQKADLLAAGWEAWQHVKPRLLDDSAVTPEMERNYSLLLIGGGDANRITRKFAAAFPLKLDAASVTIDGRRFPVTDGVVEMIRPNPSAADRYAMVVAGTSAAGLFFWDPSGYWNMPLGFPTNFYDWTIQDGRIAQVPQGMNAARGWVASGMFDQAWRRDDALTLPGDAALRSAAVLRQMPNPSFTVPAALLDAYAGRYELAPGIVMAISRTADGLLADLGGGQRFRLVAQSETRFVSPAATGLVEFSKLEAGKAASLTSYTQTARLQWRRIGD